MREDVRDFIHTHATRFFSAVVMVLSLFSISDTVHVADATLV